jgi:hypothetical protein
MHSSSRNRAKVANEENIEGIFPVEFIRLLVDIQSISWLHFK